MIPASPEPGSHIPVLMHEVVDWLVTDKNGVYVDGTFGRGGHTRALADQLGSSATLVGIDQDNSLLLNFDKSGIHQTLLLQHANFENLEQVLKSNKINSVNGILFDLGLNSATLADAARGFSFDRPGPLDMRFDQSQPLTAALVLNEYDEVALSRILFEYGEEKAARRMSHAIVQSRVAHPFVSTNDLREIVAQFTPPKFFVKALSRVFQAVRIEVNHEFAALRSGLKAALNTLAIGGRLAVISYHSLEDRIVKHYFQEESQYPAPPELQPYQATVPGRIKILTHKPILPSADEIQRNSRSRSAKLRIVERMA